MGAQTAPVSRSTDEARIRECIESWTKALHAKDVDGVMSHYTPDVLAFDLAPPLQHTAAEYRHGYAEWFKTWDGPIACEVRDLHIRVGGDVAWARSLNHLSGKRTDGDRTDVWIRATLCFEKVGGRWLAAHEHLSVPFYMDGSYRAAVDLKP
jgi:ketosteroid isomerase-like protein